MWYARPVFFVADVNRAAGFYINQLGFEKKWHSEGGAGTVCQVNRGDCEIILCQDAARGDKARLFIELNLGELAQLRREIDARAVPTKTTWWGYDTLQIDDPDGNQLFFPTGDNSPGVDTPTLLNAFADAFNRHDLDAIMSMMTSDCVFGASAGDAVDGEKHVGHVAVRAAFAEVFEQYPDAHWDGARHFVALDRSVSEWTFTGTRKDGMRVEVTGCDLFSFRDGKIAIKNSYRKNRPPFR